MKKGITALFIALGLLSMTACGNDASNKESKKEDTKVSESSKKEEPKTKELTFKGDNNNAIYKITVPESWKDTSKDIEENDDSTFQASNKKDTIHVSAIPENKQDFTNLDDFTKLTIDNFKEDGVTATFTDVTVNNYPAKRADYITDVDGVKIHVIHYNIDAENDYIQIWGSTLVSEFDANKDELEAVLTSIAKK